MAFSQSYQELRNKTIQGLFLERVKTTPHEVAYRTKKLGIYKEQTWLDFYQRVARYATGLMEFGLRRICEFARRFILCHNKGQKLF